MKKALVLRPASLAGRPRRLRTRVGLSGACLVATLSSSLAGAAPPRSSCDAALGAWEYTDPSTPGRATISKLVNGHHLLVWIMTPLDGSPTAAGAWEATCDGGRRRWRVLFSTNPAGIGSELIEEFEIEGDVAHFWLLGPDGKRGEKGRARRLK